MSQLDSLHIPLIQMRIATSLLPHVCDHTRDIDESPDVAVVIDVLRATSVMATAIAAGADQIITCREVEQAKSFADSQSTRPLLCGERNCVLIPGFDLGNSPAEYQPSKVAGKTLVLTTTNGTAAIESASSAKEVKAASFLNISAVIESLANCDLVQLICAGTDGFISNDDILLAGAIIARCETRYQSIADGDASLLARHCWNSQFPTDHFGDSILPPASLLAKALRETRGGRNLIRSGYQSDIELCSKLDSLSIVPRICGRNPISFR